MNTVLYSEGAVVATQPECIRKLEELGFGARRLYPMVLPAATSDTTFVCHSTVVQSKEGNVKDLDTSIGPLLLLDEEAFFLLYNGHISVTRGKYDIDNVRIEDLWSLFLLKDRNFPLKYKVYQFYKEKSYVIRTGLNFGADYCAYQSLPSECHSEMCVTVVDAVRANDKITSSEMSNGALCTGNSESSVCAEGTNSLGTRMDELEWKHVTTLTRLIPDVNKLCIFCYVLPAAWNAFMAPLPTPNPQPAADINCTTEGVIDVSPACASSANEDTSSQPVQKAVTRSPYLDLLFSNKTPDTSATPIYDVNISDSNCVTVDHSSSSQRTALEFIDFSSHHCLEQLTVRPVTTLVRRLPAPSATYQTVSMLQAQFQAASRLQKKREIQANKKKQRQQNKQQQRQLQRKTQPNRRDDNPPSNSSGEKQKLGDSEEMIVDGDSTQVPAVPEVDNDILDSDVATSEGVVFMKQEEQLSTSDSIVAPGSEFLIDTIPRSGTMGSSDQPTAASVVDASGTEGSAVKMSGRQKRLAKQVLVRQSKQIKKTRRDHTENRTKVMSNKNQTLLEMMQGGVASAVSISGSCCDNGGSGNGGQGAVDSGGVNASSAKTEVDLS